ncbi:MAG: FeoB-associated Cys-rich membrane protein [Lachnospiraceae bacterium]|nr:FeoB-associated Cys-rich membrane protein [Lachnospiraceae bacterium]
MFSWIQANIGTIVVAAILLMGIGFIIRSLIRNKKAGKSLCSCGCGGDCKSCHGCGSGK